MNHSNNLLPAYPLRRWWCILFAGFLVIGALSYPQVAYAATFTVTKTADTNDGACNADCSLREAIIAANANIDADTINVPAGTFSFSLSPGSEENVAATGDLDIIRTVTINGTGAGSTIIDGGNVDRVFDIAPLSVCSCTVTLSGMTIRNGRASATNFSIGGGIFINTGTTVIINNSVLSNNQSQTSSGGGIENRGTLTLNNVTMQNNTAFGLGGAINNIGSLTVDNSTFQNNSAESGGALYINMASSNSANIAGSTFTNNQAVATAGGVADNGGAIAINSDGSVSITKSTFTGNSSVQNGGAIYFNDSATEGAVPTLTLNFNRIVGNTATMAGSGLFRASGTASAENNWWGCNAGPSTAPCDRVSGTADFDPWLRLTHTASPNTVNTGAATTLTASFLTNSANAAVAASNLTALVGLPVTFNGAVGGAISGAQSSIQSNGTATAIFTAGGTAGAGAANATVDSQMVTANITIQTPPDSTPPTVVSITRASANPTNAASVNFTVTFNESVNGVDAVDFTLTTTGVSGATIGTISGSGATRTVAINTGTGSGTIRLDLVDNDTIVDGANNPLGGAGAGNGNFTTGEVYTIDKTGPSVTINQASGQTDPTSVGPINFTVVFGEAVTNFATGDVTLSGTAGATTATVTGSGTTYNVAVSGMTTNGTVIASIAANAATDALGNGNTASSSADDTVTFDTTAPTVSMSSAAPDPTNTSPILVTVQFSENVTGFAETDIVASNATVGNFVAVDGDTYSFDLTPTGQGLITADIANGVAQDTSGNGNSAAAQFSRTFDSVAPSVTINQASGQADPASSAPINFEVIFSESVSGFDGLDVNLSTSSAPGTLTANVTGSGTTYNVAVSGMTGNGAVTASILAGAATDAAGNNSAASTNTDNTVTFVAAVPDLTLTKSHTGNFSQGQTGAQYALLVTNNGTASSSGTVTVVDTLPSGLTATALSGTGWNCTVGTLTCTRSDALGASSSYPNILLTVNVASNAAASVTNSATVAGGGEQNTGNNTANDPTTINPTQPTTPVVVISSSKNGSARGLSYRDEDIIQYDPASGQWSMIFDGSDVGLRDEDVDGFAFHQGMLLLSVDDDFTLSGSHTANGQPLAVDDADILAFIPTQLGSSTKGKFQPTPYLDGSANGLNTSSEDIDAISFDGAGNLLISITGAFNAGGIKGNDEDILAFNASNGSWSLYFDGSRVGLTTDGEDVVALWVDPVNPKLYLSTHDDYNVPGVSGSEDDIIVCAYSSLGDTTACTFTRFLDGKAVGFKEAIDGISIGPVTLATIVNAADATDDTISLPGDDADDPDEIDSQVTDGEETQLNHLFLPLVAN